MLLRDERHVAAIHSHCDGHLRSIEPRRRHEQSETWSRTGDADDNGQSGHGHHDQPRINHPRGCRNTDIRIVYVRSGMTQGPERKPDDEYDGDTLHLLFPFATIFAAIARSHLALRPRQTCSACQEELQNSYQPPHHNLFPVAKHRPCPVNLRGPSVGDLLERI